MSPLIKVLQLALIGLGGVVLVAYGIFVNIFPTDFARLLGVYIVLFFIIAQFGNLLVFGMRPSPPLLVDGAFILVGGLTITFWRI